MCCTEIILLCYILYLHFKHQCNCKNHKLSASSSGVDESNYLVQNPQNTKLSTRISYIRCSYNAICFGHSTWPLSLSDIKHIEKLIIPLCVYVPIPVAARRTFAAARLVKLLVRTRSGCMDVSCVNIVLSGRGLC